MAEPVEGAAEVPVADDAEVSAVGTQASGSENATQAKSSEASGPSGSLSASATQATSESDNKLRAVEQLKAALQKAAATPPPRRADCKVLSDFCHCMLVRSKAEDAAPELKDLYEALPKIGEAAFVPLLGIKRPKSAASAKPAPATLGTRATGRVKSYNTKKGFGFIDMPGFGRDIFVYNSHLVGRIGLMAGEAVEFEFIMEGGRPQARQVKVIKEPGSQNIQIPTSLTGGGGSAQSGNLSNLVTANPLGAMKQAMAVHGGPTPAEQGQMATAMAAAVAAEVKASRAEAEPKVTSGGAEQLFQKIREAQASSALDKRQKMPKVGDDPPSLTAPAGADYRAMQNRLGFPGARGMDDSAANFNDEGYIPTNATVRIVNFPAIEVNDCLGVVKGYDAATARYSVAVDMKNAPTGGGHTVPLQLKEEYLHIENYPDGRQAPRGPPVGARPAVSSSMARSPPPLPKGVSPQSDALRKAANEALRKVSAATAMQDPYGGMNQMSPYQAMQAQNAMNAGKGLGGKPGYPGYPGQGAGLGGMPPSMFGPGAGKGDDMERGRPLQPGPRQPPQDLMGPPGATGRQIPGRQSAMSPPRQPEMLPQGQPGLAPGYFGGPPNRQQPPPRQPSPTQVSPSHQPLPAAGVSLFNPGSPSPQQRPAGEPVPLPGSGLPKAASPKAGWSQMGPAPAGAQASTSPSPAARSGKRPANEGRSGAHWRALRSEKFSDIIVRETMEVGSRTLRRIQPGEVCIQRGPTMQTESGLVRMQVEPDGGWVTIHARNIQGPTFLEEVDASEPRGRAPTGGIPAQPMPGALRNNVVVQQDRGPGGKGSPSPSRDRGGKGGKDHERPQRRRAAVPELPPQAPGALFSMQDLLAVRGQMSDKNALGPAPACFTNFRTLKIPNMESAERRLKRTEDGGRQRRREAAAAAEGAPADGDRPFGRDRDAGRSPHREARRSKSPQEINPRAPVAKAGSAPPAAAPPPPPPGSEPPAAGAAPGTKGNCPTQ